MDQHEEDLATLTVVLERFEHWRHREALAIKSRLEKGESLTERDIEFLERISESVRELLPIIERNPSYHKLAVKAIALFDEITRLAEQNEVQLKPKG